jgi:3-hydroxyisobutyrate dehydrogenase-like beta-hydroxyacid dehydrogenase
VWSRDAKKGEPLAKAGAKIAPSPKALAEASDVVVACVADPAAVERVVFAPDGVLAAARPGFRYVEASTVSPDLTRRMAEAFRAKGADVLEAPMTGSKNGADKGTLLFMCGGRQATFDELQPVLMTMGTKAILCGEVGAGSTVKLIGNTFISFLLEALCECSVLAKKAGVPLGKVLEVVMASGFSSPYFPFKGGQIQNRDFEQHFSVDLLVKDQTLMLAEAAQHKVSMPGLAAIREVCQSARAQGFGQEDIAAVVKVLERAAGV